MPNLLSLDAPLVAVSWLYVFARSWRVDYHPWQAYAALGLAVWAVYAFDRVLDGLIRGEAAALEERHRFHYRHRRWFLAGSALAMILAVVIALFAMPFEVVRYALIIGVLVAAFFSLAVFANPAEGEIPYAKNILAGVVFALGTAVAAHIYLPVLGLFDLLGSREWICFAVLCVLNITAIDLWEHAEKSADSEQSTADELMLTFPLALLGAATLVFAVMDKEGASRPFFYSILIAAGLLQAINRSRSRFSMGMLRVLADAAMLAPIPVFLAMSTAP
jgi:hypothetical protein